MPGKALNVWVVLKTNLVLYFGPNHDLEFNLPTRTKLNNLMSCPCEVQDLALHIMQTLNQLPLVKGKFNV